MIRKPGTHGYICECSNTTCTKRLYLTQKEYEELSAKGVVVHIEHMDMQRAIFMHGDEVVVMKTTLVGEV